MHDRNKQNSPKVITSPEVITSPKTRTSPKVITSPETRTSPKVITSPKSRTSPKIRDFKINRNKSRRERNEEHFKQIYQKYPL